MNQITPLVAPLRFGPLIASDKTTFRLWAPSLPAADLIIDGRPARPMVKAADGFFTVDVEDAGLGTRYMFRSGDLSFPDIASRQQHEDANGWSVVRAPLAPGRGNPVRPWHEAVICEVHVGAATPEGTFVALSERLEHFRDAGFTCLEIMPVNEFPGVRNWGYDGTLIFAPEHAYGSPENLRALVDHAHELGLSLVRVTKAMVGPGAERLPGCRPTASSRMSRTTTRSATEPTRRACLPAQAPSNSTSFTS